MDVNKVKFMCIGSNCYGMAPLMDLRVHGPIDNMLALNGLFSTVSLFNGDFEKNLLHGGMPQIQKSNIDDGFVYNYDYFRVVHNDPSTEKFKIELKRRIDVFKNFYKEFKHNKNLWFLYTLGQFDVKFSEGIGKGENTQELMSGFLNGYECLKKYNIFDRTLFVGNTHSVPKANFAKFHSMEVARLGLHYIEIKDIYIPEPEKNHKEFIEIIKNL